MLGESVAEAMMKPKSTARSRCVHYVCVSRHSIYLVTVMSIALTMQQWRHTHLRLHSKFKLLITGQTFAHYV